VVLPAPVAAVLLALSLSATAPALRVGVTVPVGTTTTALAAPAGAACPQWWGLAAAVGWPAGQLPTVDRVMRCESGCDPAAHNRSGASGLMQVMPMWWAGRDPYDPATNLAMALEVWQVQGWRAWTCW